MTPITSFIDDTTHFTNLLQYLIGRFMTISSCPYQSRQTSSRNATSIP
jgi:hypothetical protein